MSAGENGRSPSAEDEADPQEVTLLNGPTTPPLIEKFQIEETEDAISEKGFEVDSKKVWFVAVACAWIMCWTLLLNRSGGLLYISFQKELNMTSTESAAPMSMAGAMSNIFAIVSGLVIRRLPLPVVSLLGTVLTSIGILTAGIFYNKIAITYSIGIITASGQSLIFLTNMVAVNTYFKKNRTTASGISYIGGTIVSFFMPFAYKTMEDKYGLRFTLLLTGAFTLIALLGAIAFRYPPRQPKQENNNTTTKEEEANVSIKREQNDSLLAQLGFLKRPIFYLIVLTGIIFAYDLVLFNVTVVSFAMEKGLDYTNSLRSLWFYATGDAIGRLFSGQLSDRGYLRRRTVISIAFLLAAIAYFGLAFAPNKVVYLGLCFLYGLAAGSTMILFSVLMTEYLGLENLALAMGTHCLANGVAALPRQRVLGWLKADSDSHISVYLFMALISVVVSIIWGAHSLYMNIREHRRKMNTRRTPNETSDDTKQS